jgi:hypothetical protein
MLTEQDRDQQVGLSLLIHFKMLLHFLDLQQTDCRTAQHKSKWPGTLLDNTAVSPRSKKDGTCPFSYIKNEAGKAGRCLTKVADKA